VREEFFLHERTFDSALEPNHAPRIAIEIRAIGRVGVKPFRREMRRLMQPRARLARPANARLIRFQITQNRVLLVGLQRLEISIETSLRF
jgi:hypothetical protein